jgi:spore maturation protein CgeB
MRALVVGPQFADSFAQNVVVTLEAMGHTVACEDGTKTRHNGSRYFNALWRGVYQAIPALELSSFNRLVSRARELQPELVLVTHCLLPPQVVSMLKESCSAKVVCWFTDHAMNLHRQYLLACPYDSIFLKEPFLVRLLKEKLGVDAHYLPECCNPMWHKPAPLTDEERATYSCDLVAAGTLHYYRARMVERFDDYDLKVWGHNAPAWLQTSARGRYMNHYVSCDEKAKAYSAAKILLNTMFYAEIEGLNCTLFEAAGCGAFQIADWKPSLQELFEPEREIVTFRTRQELKDKVDYYLAHPKERHKIANRAYVRAHREHTYEIRLRRMLGTLGLYSDSARFPETTLATGDLVEQRI